MSINIQGNAMPSKRLVATYVVVALGAILYLPYFFPQHPSASDSYLFGYNNRIGLILLLLFSVAAAILTRVV